jgi:hypothetical protein
VPRRPLALALLLVGTAAPLMAQRPALTVTADTVGARLQAQQLLANGQFVQLLRSGFPLRLHYRLELWRHRANWWDRFVQSTEWDVVARHDPLADDFVVLRTGGTASRYATPDRLARALEIPYLVTLRADQDGRCYNVGRLEVTTLSESDLEELTRWMQGDVGPAVRERGNVGDALSRGAQRALLRLAGLPRLTLEGRSGRFRAEP